MFEEQAVIKPKSSAHSHRSSAQDEDKVLHDLHKLKPFSPIIGRSHKSFVGISSDPLENLNEQLFCEWLKRHQKNIALHFPTVDGVSAVQPSDDGNEQSDNVDNLKGQSTPKTSAAYVKVLHEHTLEWPFVRLKSLLLQRYSTLFY